MAVAITGVGMATVLGTTAPQTWDALLAGRFITDHSRIPVDTPRGACRVTHWATAAAREAIAEAGWSPETLADEGTAMLVGTSKGPIEQWIAAPAALGSELAPTMMGRVADQLAQQIGLGSGARLTLCGACASGLQALVRGLLMIRASDAKRVLVVASESSVHPLFLGSFRRLGVLPRDGRGCRPFDRSRDGFIMSEAAAAVCLEQVAPATAPPGAVLVADGAIAGDAAHITGADPRGRALRRLLARVVGEAPVALFHAHGTGTDNDPTELAAIESVVQQGGGVPLVYSHKGALGHSLGASGLVSVVINAMAHRTGVVPPNVQTAEPIAHRRVSFLTGGGTMPIDRSIAMAQGFGGAMAVVALGR